MHFYQSESRPEEEYRRFAEIPLPAAAVVIDVREQSVYDIPLLDYLALEVEDLAKEMRLNQVPRWRHLAECMDFVKVDRIVSQQPLHEQSDFAVTRGRAEKPDEIHGLQDLAAFLGRDYLDCVRNHRISAIADADDEAISGQTAGSFIPFSTNNVHEQEARFVDPEQPTVRVFFLTDMEDKDSVRRAIIYASWLKKWVEEQHGSKRFNQDECIQTTMICLNVDATISPTVLFPAISTNHYDDVPFDICLLLQKYRNDAAFIGGDEQLLHVDLLLYTLLLHWPAIFENSMSDIEEAEAITMVNKGSEWPRPTYTVGIASREYSARWAARWLDYGVTARLLQIMGTTETIEQAEEQYIDDNIRKWLRNWWQELRDVVPVKAVGEIDEVQVLGDMHRLLRGDTFLQSTPIESLSALEAFKLSISTRYIDADDSLEAVMLKSPDSIAQQFKWVYGQRTQPSQNAEQDIVEPDEFYSPLITLYTRIRHFLTLHFRGAEGSLPRAACQLSALTTEVTSLLRTKEQNPSDLRQSQKDFANAANKAQKELERQLKIIRIPGLGGVLHSTVVSVLIIVVVGILLLLGVNQSIAQTQLLPDNLFVLPGVDIVLVALLAGGEYLYLRVRNKALREERRKIHAQLRNIVLGHISAVQDVIAARVALQFLQWSDLYKPGETASPYEQRLRQLIQQLRRTQVEAVDHQRMVDKRLQPLLGWQGTGTTRWPDLKSRKDLLPWRQLEDAFLLSLQELMSNTLSLNLLSEMLLRRVGTEKPVHILQDIMDKRMQAAKGGEEQFHALTTMLVSVVLAADIVSPTASDVVPLLQQYTALQDHYEAPPTLNANFSGMQLALKEAVLTQALQRRTNNALSLLHDVDVSGMLVSWVGMQHQSNPVLEQILSSSDVVLCLVERRETLPQVLDALRSQSILLGYSDDMTSDRGLYLLLAPGEASETFLRSNDVNHAAIVHPTLFPDKERLVHMHIQRLRQLSLAAPVATKKRE